MSKIRAFSYSISRKEVQKNKMDGKIFHTKEVLGQYGRPFTIHKFRTMIPDADKLYHFLAKKNGFHKNGKIISDPRITKLGSFLREYFIDEIPQFYNIIKREMNVVGIRPRTNEEWKTEYPEKHKINSLRYKPGLLGVPYYYTGLNSLSDIMEAETEYIERKKKNPIKTDIHYKNRIIQNILFKKLRSF